MTFLGEKWRGVQRFVQDIRINADFPRYELEARSAHEASARRRFDTSQLDHEITAILRAAEAEGCAVYGARIGLLESSISSLHLATSQVRTRVELMARDFGQELSQLHEKKASLLDAKEVLLDQMRALKKERSIAREELDVAHGDLREAKSLIDSWYEKSKRTPWLFGNGGKRLPDRALFGQSFGDLESLKADRERAFKEVGTCKAALAKIVAKQSTNKLLRDENQTALSSVFASINSVKEGRQRMFDLKDQGYRCHSLEAELSECVQQEAHLQSERNQLASTMGELVEQQACRSGIDERRRAVAELREMRTKFLAFFDDSEQRTARQQAHREWWLNGRKVL
ncbi:hypothetical protein [Acidovorax sp. Root219]|uniref:hypothetical protein n=1 Tax=Acidovorax sp. Root219 TaxID=1736493 RepID=UPI000A76ABAC|nr:hypothetical protein [Acidovorax sp. Root219]